MKNSSIEIQQKQNQTAFCYVTIEENGKGEEVYFESDLISTAFWKSVEFLKKHKYPFPETEDVQHIWEYEGEKILSWDSHLSKEE